MKQKIVFTSLLLVLFILSACSDDDVESSLKTVSIPVDDRVITSYVSNESHEHLIVFESGLGDDGSIWLQKNIISEIMKSADVVIYDRAGYKASDPAEAARDITHLSDDLSAVIERHSNGRKVILVGHSLGGWVIRDYAIKNPENVNSLLFVDTSHEHYNDSTTSQSVEDQIYDFFKSEFGVSHGATNEARQLMEDINYAATLEELPNIPVVILTSMKTDAQHNLADRQNAYNAQHELTDGVTDFIHVNVQDSGHYIQLEKPQLIIQYLKGWIQ